MTTITSRFFFLPLLVLTFALHFSVFGESPHNPYGITMVNELYLAICLCLTAFLILAMADEASREIRILMYYCLYSTVVFLVLPAVFAYFTYGQPIVYGLIEERRILFCLGFVPLLLLSKRVSTLDRKSTRLNSSHVKISYAVF